MTSEQDKEEYIRFILKHWNELRNSPYLDKDKILEALVRRTLVDRLTNHPSHEQFIIDVEALKSDDRPVGLIAADVIGLKLANDAYSHEVGDATIKLSFDVFDLMIESVCGPSGGKIYRGDKGDAINALLYSSEEQVEEVVRRIRRTFGVLNVVKGSYILGNITRINKNKDRVILAIVDGLLKKYSILPPELPIYTTLGYSYSPDGRNIFETYHSQADLKERAAKAEFYKQYPQLNLRDRLGDVIQELRKMAEEKTL